MPAIPTLKLSAYATGYGETRGAARGAVKLEKSKKQKTKSSDPSVNNIGFSQARLPFLR